MAVIAFDLGGTKLAGAVFDEKGTIVFEDTRLLERRGGADVGQLLITLLNHLTAKADHIDAIAVSVPGIAHTKTGRVWAPNIAGWEDYPLRDEIRASLSYEDVPVFVEDDRSCSILGEAWHGAARGCRNAVFLAVGTGIGAGILVDGRVLHGSHDIAGAIGWMALERPWDEKFAGCGNFEYYASGDGIARAARELLAERSAYTGPLRLADPSQLTAHEIFSAYDTGDEIAFGALARAIELWGKATANLVSLLNPDRIIFGGGVFGPATRFLDDVMSEAKRWAQPIAITRVQLLPSTLGPNAALHGAGYVALRAAMSFSENHA